MQLRVAGNDEFRGAKPAQHLIQAAWRNRLDDELAGGEVNGGETSTLPPDVHRHNPVVASPGHPAFLEEGARGQRLHDFAAHQTLGFLGILDLLTNRDAVPVAHQLPEIFRGRLHRNACERDPVSPGCERDAQHPRGELGVVEEHLVEIAHPEKENRVAMARFDLPVLDQQRGVFGERDAHGTRTTNGWAPTFVRDFSRRHVGLAPAPERAGPELDQPGFPDDHRGVARALDPRDLGGGGALGFHSGDLDVEPWTAGRLDGRTAGPPSAGRRAQGNPPARAARRIGTRGRGDSLAALFLKLELVPELDVVLPPRRGRFRPSGRRSTHPGGRWRRVHPRARPWR